MDRSLLFAAFCLLISSPSAFAAAPPDDAETRGRDFVPHEILVKFRPGVRAADVTAQIPGLEFRSQSPGLSVARLVPSGAALYRRAETQAATLRLLERIRQRPDVLYAQPNYLFELSHTPNDLLYPQQWHYPMVGLPAAWDITRGSSTIKIAILDTGRNYHPELAGKWLPNEYNADQPGYNATDRSKFSHGTHVAGIAAASSNNNTGIAGVCQNCMLLNVKVTNERNRIPLSNVISGIDWAIANGADIMNMSFEFPEPCTPLRMPALRDAIARATAENIVVTAAAGNQNAVVDGTSPASCPGAISVAATDRNGKWLAPYSNSGANVGITAPGGGGAIVFRPDGILDREASTVYGDKLGAPRCPDTQDTLFNPNEYGAASTWSVLHTVDGVARITHCYRYLSGTSMASPHVAGTVGLMLSVNSQLTPAQIASILQRTAKPLPLCGSDCGPGLLDAHAAVVAARDAATSSCGNEVGCPP